MSDAVPQFRSFWIAGFESAAHINKGGVRLDMLAATQHDAQADTDYALLREVGIRTARDGVRWHLIDRGGQYDFASLAPQVEAARQHGVQVVWDLCHYGWPDDVDVFAPDFPHRFAAFAGATARFIAENGDGDVPYFTPINEISYLTYQAGDAARFYPFATRRGGELKRNLVRAAIQACDAIWAVDSRARIVHVDPTIHVVPPPDRPDLAQAALDQRNSKWEAWDMLAGHIAPELGGDPRYLDIIGLNFYYDSEWQFPEGRLRWEETPRDPRWMRLRDLLTEAWERYHRPLIVAETSHFGAGRVAWLREITGEVRAARERGTPLYGVCIYPILDRPDWDDPNHWHNSGLFDLPRDPDGTLRRVLNTEYGAEFQHSREVTAQQPPATMPPRLPFGLDRLRRP